HEWGGPQHVDLLGGKVALRDTAAATEPKTRAARQSYAPYRKRLRPTAATVRAAAGSSATSRQGETQGMPVTASQPSPHSGARHRAVPRLAGAARLGLLALLALLATTVPSRTLA